jgi:integrase
LDQVVEFEKSIGSKLVLKDLSQDNVYEFANYLEENGYNSSTIERAIGRLKFILNRAFEHDIKTSKVRNQRIYIEKEEDAPDKPYLTEKEINLIINKDFSFDPELQIAKQHYIILLFTGLRGSDGLKKLDISNIENDLIKIKTTKTGQTVVLPLHQEVKKVIKQNFGNLPPKMSLSDFNVAIKKIAQVCEIDQLIKGKMWDSKKKRKVLGIYKKYELLSSHSCRRGFVTLYKDVISQEAMASILGWSTTEMLKVYNQTSKEEYASELEKAWLNKK